MKSLHFENAVPFFEGFAYVAIVLEITFDAFGDLVFAEVPEPGGLGDVGCFEEFLVEMCPFFFTDVVLDLKPGGQRFLISRAFGAKRAGVGQLGRNEWNDRNTEDIRELYRSV